MQPKFDKKIEILTLYPANDEMVNKPSHATVPLSSLTRTSMFTFDLAATYYNFLKESGTGP
jgi:hypothetical protein